MKFAICCWIEVLALLVAAPLLAQGDSDVEAPSGLSLEQQSLASRFERLEAVAARLAELAAQSEPEHAEQLRRALKASREKGIAERFETIVELIEGERLAAAARDQEALRAELETLLQVLLEDPGDAEREAMKTFLKEQIRELGKLIRQQRSLRNQTLEGADAERLADEQSKVGEAAGDVQKNLEQNGERPANEDQGEGGEGSQAEPQEGQPQNGQPQEGEPQQGQPAEGQQGQGQPSNEPMERAAQRVEQARRAMQQAEQRLREAQRDGAAEEQRKAQRELEAARAELERILRQLREEEMERLLAKLAARFREMLAVQRSIYDDTAAIHQETAAGTSRTLMLQAIRLSRREAELVQSAEKALQLLREDGTSVAFPVTAEQIADDMRSVTARLAAADVGPITQTIEADIIAGLEDMIAALDAARDELAQRQGESQPPSSGGQPGESPLVPKLAELRMIRTLQARVYKRTQDLGALAENPQVERQDLLEELGKLADRQQHIFQATRDLDTGVNQ